MPRYFLDSSALVKRYHQENGTPAVEALFDRPGNQLFVSQLALVEVHSSFARLVRERVLTELDFGKLIALLENDAASGMLAVATVSSRRLIEASALLGTHGLVSNIRTLDAIHLATAQALHGRRPSIIFVAADRKLLSIAGGACGLAILDVS